MLQGMYTALVWCSCSSFCSQASLLIREGNVLEFADPRLKGEYSVDAFDLCLKLALSCTGHKQQRPSMEQVVSRLEKALWRVEGDFAGISGWHTTYSTGWLSPG
uniref:Serine-threonine/tyrosine-protein kinase catalytic domain-containing protein n=1 Tax=Aegilops tauschii subsp. strangulata TaxID=200361 RepID=A0A453C663_AEGTS